jgi:hypothetical protein
MKRWLDEKRSVVISDKNVGENHFTLDVVITEKDDLSMRGCDSGPWVEDVGSKLVGCDDDYEYEVTVEAKHKDDILLRLISERFENDGDFTSWLKKHEIPSSFWSW